MTYELNQDGLMTTTSDPSRAAEVGVADAVARKRAEVWLVENREALESSNTYCELHGLPLSRYRNF